MELLVTIAYFFLVRLVFFDYKLLRFNLFWKFVVFGLWVLAALTEVVFLGQLTPYSKEMFVQAYVVPIAPEYGGLVTEVQARPNVPVKKGDPLFQMDPEPWQYRVEKLEAQLAAADTDVAELNQQVEQARAQVERIQADLEIARVKYTQVAAAAEKSAASKVRLEQSEGEVHSLEAELRAANAAQRQAEIALASEIGDEHTAIAEVLAELNSARYNLRHTTVRAPADGYPVNLQLHPGAFIRLKEQVMTFVSTEKHWIVAKVLQRGSQWIAAGDHAEVAFGMYPGKVFPAEVESIVWASGNAQGKPSGSIPLEMQVHPPQEFFVRLRMMKEDPQYPLRFGASGLAAIHTRKAADALIFLRQLEIRSESFLNYVYNPF